jgi:dipeptidyl aminopeptidase/acylaminoacyl peptidase
LWDQSTPWVRRLLAHQLGHPARRRDLYRQRSPIEYADRVKSPVLLLHGEADASVPPEQSRAFADRLAAEGHPVELVSYPGEGHGFNEPHHLMDAASRITDFFDRWLR